MKRVSPSKSKRSRRVRGVEAVRRSASADQSFAAELRRLQGMSIEERVAEALGLNARVSSFRVAQPSR